MSFVKIMCLITLAFMISGVCADDSIADASGIRGEESSIFVKSGGDYVNSDGKIISGSIKKDDLPGPFSAPDFDLFEDSFPAYPDQHPLVLSYHPDDIYWTKDFSSNMDLSGVCNALCVYNGILYAGGTFEAAGDAVVNHIAAWDGVSWSSLGRGLTRNDGVATVNALIVYNGLLVIGGNFDSVNGVSANNIAAWNGTTWAPLGLGMNGIVRALTIFNDMLIAGGNFTTADGINVNYIAQWDGTSWVPLGSGMAGDGSKGNPFVFSLTVYNDKLIAGGGFTFAGGVTANGIAAWDGSAWSSLGFSVGSSGNNYVFALGVFENNLIAGGRIDTVGSIPTNNIFSWNGSAWTALNNGPSDGILSIIGYQDKIIVGVGGGFDINTSLLGDCVFAWDGVSWSILGGGLTSTESMDAAVKAFAIYENQLYAGGNFNYSSGWPVKYIAKWNDNNWAPLTMGTSGIVTDLQDYNSKLYIGGDFSTINNIYAHRLAVWDGSEWAEFGNPIWNGLNWQSRVNSFTVYNNMLVVSGHFDSIGGIAAKNIAAWDGIDWYALGEGLNDAAYCFEAFNNQLIAAGYFTEADGIPAHFIAAWDGSSWSPLGSGMNYYVSALKVYNNTLIAGGSFTTAGNIEANGVAAWNGNSWRPLDVGVDGSVLDLEIYDGQLIVSGTFNTAGGVDVNKIAAWDGSFWYPLGAGVEPSPSSFVRALESHGGVLVAGGYFHQVGGVDANSIAAWDGDSWVNLGSGISGGRYPYVFSLESYNNNLMVCGGFLIAGSDFSVSIAEWTDKFYTCGDTNNDGAVDLADVFYLIDYYFYSGPESYLFISGDINCDGNIDIVDIVLLADHINNGGGAPCCP